MREGTTNAEAVLEACNRRESCGFVSPGREGSRRRAPRQGEPRVATSFVSSRQSLAKNLLWYGVFHHNTGMRFARALTTWKYCLCASFAGLRTTITHGPLSQPFVMLSAPCGCTFYDAPLQRIVIAPRFLGATLPTSAAWVSERSRRPSLPSDRRCRCHWERSVGFSTRREGRTSAISSREVQRLPSLGRVFPRSNGPSPPCHLVCRTFPPPSAGVTTV